MIQTKIQPNQKQQQKLNKFQISNQLISLHSESEFPQHK